MDRIGRDCNRWDLLLGREAMGEEYASATDTPSAKFRDEVFTALYSGDNVPLPPERQDTKWTHWSERFHNIVQSNPDWTAMTHQCNGNLLSAAIAAEQISATIWPDDQDPPPPPPGDGPGQPGDGEGKGPGVPGGNGTDPLDSEMRKRLREAMNKAEKAVEEADDAVQGLMAGSQASAGSGTMDAKTVQSIMARLKKSPGLLRIAALAGRFRRVAQATRATKVKHSVDEVMDVEIGRDLGQMLPQEAVRLLGSSGTRMSFYADFIAGKIQQYRIGGTEKKGKGPVIVCIDKSGSMHGARDEWATAVALAFLGEASKDKRPFVLIPFTYGPRGIHRVEPGQDLPLAALLVPASGGTSIDATLNAALDIVEADRKDKGTMAKADIVLVTDGDCGSDGKVKERATALDCRVTGIGIDTPKGYMDPWSHDAVCIESLDTKGAEQAFGVAFNE